MDVLDDSGYEWEGSEQGTEMAKEKLRRNVIAPSTTEFGKRAKKMLRAACRIICNFDTGVL